MMPVSEPSRGRRNLTVRALGAMCAAVLVAAPSLAAGQPGGGGRGAAVAGPRYRIVIGDETTFVRLSNAARQLVQMKLDSLTRELQSQRFNTATTQQLSRELNNLMLTVRELDRHDTELRRIGQNLAQTFNRPLVRACSLTSGQCADGRTLGWIGLLVEGVNERVVRDDSTYVRFFTRPEIVSVEPGSPAERSGILRGDTLVAYNGANVSEREINLTKLLQPGRRVVVTISRDGEQRDYSVSVVRQPARMMLRAEEAVAVPVPSLPAERPRRFSTTPTLVFQNFGATSAPIAGATLVEITSENEGLGKPFNVRSGLLVTEVLQGTLARQAGLVGGDVIVRVEGRPVTSVLQLRRAMEAHSDERVLQLQIVRDKQPQPITLRW